MIILIPIAGQAKSFSQAGFVFPKALVEILGKPMIQWVIENCRALDAGFVFVCNYEDIRLYNLDTMLKVLAPGCRVTIQERPAQGAACSALLAVDHINNDDELIVAGGDQYLDVDLASVIGEFRDSVADAGVITFPSVHPQYSYAQVDEDNWVIEVAEKKPISAHATVGIYWYRRGVDFVEAAMRMIEKRDMFNGQYYLCPVFNQLILGNKRILNKSIRAEEFVSFGTPDAVRRIGAIGRLH
jgi:NDP-sugar pyrophosphorylase family protein